MGLIEFFFYLQSTSLVLAQKNPNALHYKNKKIKNNSPSPNTGV